MYLYIVASNIEVQLYMIWYSDLQLNYISSYTSTNLGILANQDAWVASNCLAQITILKYQLEHETGGAA